MTLIIGMAGGSQPSAIIVPTGGAAVFPQEIMPGPVNPVNVAAADCCQTDLGQTVTGNNS